MRNGVKDKRYSLITVILVCFSLSAFVFPVPVYAGGEVVAWGNNDFGQCTVPSPNTDFIAIAAGGEDWEYWACHSLGLKADGSIVAWGNNDFGQCSVPAPNTGFIAVAAGAHHSLGLKSDGSIVAWGSTAPVPSPNTDFIAIAAGGYHSLGLKADGSIVAWGDNGFGQCDVPSPNADFNAIAAGGFHSLGLKADGSIVAWGDNGFGQCNVPSPNADFNAIAAGGSFWEWSGHSLGLKADGSIVAWGYNDFGQCSVPSPNTDFIAIAAGLYHSLGLKTDSSIVGWGYNDFGQCNAPSPNTGFKAIAAGGHHSLGLKLATPIFSPDGGTYTNPVDVTITVPSGATVHYTTNGVDPNESDPVYSSPINISTTTTLKARAWKAGWEPSAVKTATYTIIVETPTFSPDGGIYTIPVDVTISCGTPEATIHYTTNGVDPTESDPVYSSPITISTTTTLKARAWKAGGWDPSAVKSANYTITGTVATPAFSPDGGTYTSPVDVTISCETPGATIHYTTNGVDPTGSDPVYSSPIHISITTTLKAKAWKSGWDPSAVNTANYTILVVDTPTFSPDGGTYTNPVDVTISCGTPDATIHYTTNGVDPTESDPVYSSPITISTTTTLKAGAWKSGWYPSLVKTANYTIIAETPTFSPGGGIYTSPVDVNISCGTSGATIHYTTNGVDPTESDPVYSSPINISATTILKARAWKPGWDPSGVATAIYSIISYASGEVVAWGLNDYGQCDVPSPNTDFTAVAAGGGNWEWGAGHSLGLKTDGSIMAWGWNDYGQCTVPSPNMDFTAVAAGGCDWEWGSGHSLGLKTDGSIMAWGYNGYGQCSVPSPNTDFIAIAAGSHHSLGLKADGSIVAWGRNDWGQCSVPSPNTDFIAITAGGWHSLGLKADGSIVAWGYNDFGQCNVPSPNTGFIAIAGGGYHSLGLKANGSIVAWGNNDFGQCSVPSPNTDFIAIAAGGYHSLGLKADGSIVAWGYNDLGQCDIPSPNTGFKAVAAGAFHSLGLKTNFNIIAPNGGELLVAGSTCNITWSSADSFNVLIEYSTDNGSNWADINTVPNTGSYLWLVPQKTSNLCLVRISDANDANTFDTSNNTFTIYQCQLPTMIDLDFDCDIDLWDLEIFATQWLTEGPEADLDGLSTVDFNDFAIMASEWLQNGNPFDLNNTLDIVLVPRGSFKYQNTTPMVYVESFMIDKFEITNESYCLFLNEADPNAEHWDGQMAIDRLGSEGSYYYTVQSGKEKYPVCFVTISDANAFAAWRSVVWQATYRLPTEEEWEKAAAWDPVEPNYYLYGFHQNTINCPWANYNNCFAELLPIGSFDGTSGKNNAKSYYGCYDMSGNLWEWTSGVSGDDHIVRGGSWSTPEGDCTTLTRYPAPPTERYEEVGLRLVRELD